MIMLERKGGGEGDEGTEEEEGRGCDGRRRNAMEERSGGGKGRGDGGKERTDGRKLRMMKEREKQ